MNKFYKNVFVERDIMSTNKKQQQCSDIELVSRLSIQPFAAVLVHDHQGQIINFSENFSRLAEQDKNALSKSRIEKVLTIDQYSAYQNWLSSPVSRHYDFVLTLNENSVYLRKQSFENRWLIEMESVTTVPVINNYALCLEQLREMQSSNSESSLNDKTQVLIQFLSETLHLDAVRVYQFNPWDDNTGKTLAEKKIDVLPSFLNYRFPAYDVPEPVRKNYLTALYRYIPDIHAQSQGFYHENSTIASMLSLIDSRSVADVHQEYIANMGVQSAFSIPVIVNNRLWGLIACQHQTAKYIHPQDRFYARLLVEHFSLDLTLYYEKALNLQRKELMVINDKIKNIFNNTSNIGDVFKDDQINLCQKMEACGFAFKMENEWILKGDTPNASEIAALHRWLKQQTPSDIFYTHELRYQYPKAKAFSFPVCGVMMIDLLHNETGFILVFRKEYVKEIVWAGNPNQTIKNHSRNKKHSPRDSFAAWREEVKGKSKPWLDKTVEIARLLKQTVNDKWLQQIWFERSMLDPLTKVHNRNYLHEQFFEHDSKAKRQIDLPLSVSMLDIDDFKHINDTYGHPFGDIILKKVADILTQQVRRDDLICRYGGEEFLLIFKGCPIEEGEAIIKEILKSIRHQEVVYAKDEKVKITMSAGISCDEEGIKTLETLIKEADEALYQAKKAGKDQVVRYKENE